MNGNTHLNIFIIIPFYLNYDGNIIEVYTEKDIKQLEAILSKYHYVYDGGYRKEPKLFSPKDIKAKFDKVIQFEDKKEE